MLKFEPLCWIYHDTWKWKQTKIIISPNGDVQDLSKTYTHPGHIHLFFDGKDVSKITNTKAYTGTQDYSFQVQDVWGPNSEDPNQIQSFRMIGTPIWYIYVEQYWRRMYVQSWDYDTDFTNGIHDGKGGIKYDASKPQHTLGPFREGAQMFFFNTTVNRTLPIEYYLDKNKTKRQLYIKDSSNSNDTSGGKIWRFGKQGELYDWMGNTWVNKGKISYWYFEWYDDGGESSLGYTPIKKYTINEKEAKDKAQQFATKIGVEGYIAEYMDEQGVYHTLKTVDDCYGVGADEQEVYNQNDERHHPLWNANGYYRGIKKTTRINTTDTQVFNGTNAKRIHKDGQNMLSSKEVLWQAYSSVFEDEKWYKFITKDTTNSNRWNIFTHFYSATEFESWKAAFEDWQKNKLSYRSIIDYGNALYFEPTSGEDPVKVQDLTQSNAYPYEFNWTIDSDNMIQILNVSTENTWYEILEQQPPLGDGSYPKYRYSVPVPLPKDFQSEYSTSFDNEWVGYYEYREVVKYKDKYYRRMWKPYGYNVTNFGYDYNTEKEIMMENNVITSEMMHQNSNYYQDEKKWYVRNGIVLKQYSIHRRHFFPNPPPDGLPYDGKPQHDMYWEYMMYFGKIKGSAQDDNYDVHFHYDYVPPNISSTTLEYDSNSTTRYWYDRYRDLWGTVKYHKIDMSKYTEEQINQWEQEQEIEDENDLIVPYAYWNDTQKQTCFYKYLDILYADNQFEAFQDKYSKTIYDTDDDNDYPKIKQGEIPTYLQFFEFCNIWQELTPLQVSLLNLDGDMPKDLSNASTLDIQACFNLNNPLDPFTLSNSAVTAWLKRYNRREIYTIPEDTYCKGDKDAGQSLHPYYHSYSEQDGARRYYPDDKYLSPIIEYQKIIHKNWTLYNSNSYDILNDTGDPGYVPKWKYCEPQELNTDPISINISIPFVDIQGDTMSPFSENKNSPTLPIGRYSSHGQKVIPTENRMRYHVEWFDSLAQVKKYNLPEYIRLINLWNNSFPQHQISDDYISNTQPPIDKNNGTITLKEWFYDQSTSTSPYFNNSTDEQGNIIHTPLIPVLRRNDEDTHVALDMPFHYSYKSIIPNPEEAFTTSFIEVSNSCVTSYVYRAPLTQLCVTKAQVAKLDNNTYGYHDSKGKIRQGGNIVSFNDPYHKEDGKWFEQCLGAIVKAKAIIIFENGLGHRWYEQVTTTELQSDTPLRGLDY